jgi:hypothetical protein
MNTQLMTQAQESTLASALWSLEDGEAMRLAIGPGVREVHVTEGRLWLTREGTTAQPAEDLWLQAGDTVEMDSGTEWVVEGWGTTHFQLLVPPRACATQQLRRSPRALPGVPSLRPAFG